MGQMEVVWSSRLLWGLLVVRLERTGSHLDPALCRLCFCLVRDLGSRCVEVISVVACSYHLFYHRSVDGLELESVGVSQLDLLGLDVLGVEKISLTWQLSLWETETVCASFHLHSWVCDHLFLVECETLVYNCSYRATEVFWEENELCHRIFWEESRVFLAWEIFWTERSLWVS